jgi:hypothetical protein
LYKNICSTLYKMDKNNIIIIKKSDRLRKLDDLNFMSYLESFNEFMDKRNKNDSSIIKIIKFLEKECGSTRARLIMETNENVNDDIKKKN